MNAIRKQIIELIEPYMNKTLKKGCLLSWGEVINSDSDVICKDGDIFFRPEIEDEEIIGHYDISAVFGYINSINLGGIGPYYFDSVSISKDYYIMTPTGDNDYARIPNKPLHLYTEQEEKDLLNLLIKIGTN